MSRFSFVVGNTTMHEVINMTLLRPIDSLRVIIDSFTNDSVVVFEGDLSQVAWHKIPR